MGWLSNYGLQNKSAVIAINQTVSGAVDLAGALVFGLHLPAALTGTAFTFQAAPTNSDGSAGTYAAVKDDTGAAVSVVVGTSRFVALDPNLLAGVRFLKVVSGSTELAARTIVLATRPY